MAPRGGSGVDRLPAGFVEYKRTPTFDGATLPDGLKQNHKLKPGVWGVITVERGRLLYAITSDKDVSFELDLDTPGLVAPEELHRVQIIEGDTKFHVAFYRSATS